jgi:hypothetical protein
MDIRAQPDRLVRRLRADDPSTWTYSHPERHFTDLDDALQAVADFLRSFGEGSQAQ